MSVQRPVCPRCGGAVTADYTCHTYPVSTLGGEPRWSACFGCASAIEYFCYPVAPETDGCGWTYTDGLNPRNPRAAANEEQRPAWLQGHVTYDERGDVRALPGVPWLWDID